MNDPDLAVPSVARERFPGVVQAVRPELLRYCARMMGSVIEGEDVVQDTLAQAHRQLPQLREEAALRGWLFQIAHNCAVNHLVARGRRAPALSLDDAPEPVLDAIDAEEALARSEAVGAALGCFLALPLAQRACVILKDVLECSLEEIAATLEMTVPAVKAALHRGRVRLRGMAAAVEPATRTPSPELVRYAALFNARDWEGVRAMLAEDVRLEVVSRVEDRGADAVLSYAGQYSRVEGWHLAPAWLDGQEVLAVRRAPADARPAYAIVLTFSSQEGKITAIRDFRYAPHVMVEARFEG